jgi:hypothetical protein
MITMKIFEEIKNKIYLVVLFRIINCACKNDKLFSSSAVKTDADFDPLCLNISLSQKVICRFVENNLPKQA